MSDLSFYDLTYEGPVVQAILDTAQKLRTEGYIFMGAGTPSTVPGTPTERVWYLCGPGTYANFGSSVTVPEGSVMVASYANSTWTKVVIAINGGAAVSGWKVVDSVASLPSSPEDPSLGWICDNTVYLYVGEGGDTLSGKYQSMGDFQGPQGEDGATGPQGPAGLDGISIGDNWTAFSSLSQLDGKTYAEKQAMVPDANAVEEVNTKIVDLGAQCTLPSQTTETVEGAVGQWQPTTGAIGTTAAIRAHLKISAKQNTRLTVVIPSGWYGAFYHVDDSNVSQSDISGGWKSGTYEFAVNGIYDVMVNIKYGSAGTTTITQSLLNGVNWTITHHTAGGYKAAAPYDEFVAMQSEMDVVNGTLYTDPSAKTIDNTNADVNNYRNYTAGNFTRGYFAIYMDKMKTCSVSVLVKNGSTIKCAIQGWTIAEDYNSYVYDSGWITPNNSATYLKNDPKIVEISLVVTYTSGNTGIPTWAEFLQYIEFSVTYTDADGLVDRVEKLEFDTIKTLGIDWSSQLLTTTYYGEKPRLTNNAYTYAQLGTLQSGTSSRQGGAVFGNYLFQFHNTLASVCVFDLSTGQNVQKINNTAIANCHANGGGFSSQFYDVSDNFPLLYISSMDECKVYVFRVTGAVGSLAMTLVQTITISSLYYLTDVAVDNDNASLVISGYAKNTAMDKTDNYNVVMSCKIPSTSGDVTISEFDNEGRLPFIFAQQGAFASFGRVFVAYGNAGSPYYDGGIIVYDYINRNVLNWIGIRAIGAIEPEACCQWGDKIVITTQDGKVYALSF